MTRNRSTITVGIPAFNEEANIGYLLEEIGKQRFKGYTLEKIIVSSDASTDATRTIVESINDPRIVFLDNKKRQGQSARQNQIIEMTDTDVLVLLNADITLDDDSFIEKLVEPVLERGADLTSSNMLMVEPTSRFEKIIAAGFRLKNNIFERYNNGLNMYTCHGAARAFSKKLYKTFRFGESVGEDGYSYLFCKKNGYKFAYVGSAVARIKLPDNIRDHQKQSIRFFKSNQAWYAEFGRPFVDAELEIPCSIGIRALIGSLVIEPISILLYLGVLCATKVKALFVRMDRSIWEISHSSKLLRKRVS